jgi:hypothetical protein
MRLKEKEGSGGREQKDASTHIQAPTEDRDPLLSLSATIRPDITYRTECDAKFIASDSTVLRCRSQLHKSTVRLQISSC